MTVSETTKARFKMLAAAAAAVGGGAASGDDAEAAIFTAAVNEVIPASSTKNPFVLNAFDLSPSLSSDFKISFMAWYGDGVFFGLENNLSFINYYSASNDDPARWGSSVVIDAGAQQGVASAGGYTPHQWYRAKNSSTTSNDLVASGGGGNWSGQGTTGFLGIRFIDGADFYYGWVQITNHDSNSAVFTVDSWAMESDAGTGILTVASGAASGAAVPEPTSLGLFALCLGAAGVRSQRRRRQQHVS